jgi:hypothetical protein
MPLVGDPTPVAGWPDASLEDGGWPGPVPEWPDMELFFNVLVIQGNGIEIFSIVQFDKSFLCQDTPLKQPPLFLIELCAKFEKFKIL